MSSILDRKFKYSVPIPAGRVTELEQWCEANIGPRLYYLHSDRGGKHWRITQHEKFKYVLETNEDYHIMTWLALTN